MNKIPVYYLAAAVAAIALVISFFDPIRIPREHRVALLLLLAWIDTSIKYEKLKRKTQSLNNQFGTSP